MSSSKLFRTAYRGYNKEDVNNYIIAINKELEDSQKRFTTLVNESNTKAQNDFRRIQELLCEQESFRAAVCQLEELTAENEALKKDLEALRKETAEKERTAETAEAYDNLCAKAGEVLVIASNTADSILKKANDEAEKIINEATDKKDSMIKNITETATNAADGLSEYIKNAVDECIDRINSSIRAVEALKDVPEDTIPVMKYQKS